MSISLTHRWHSLLISILLCLLLVACNLPGSETALSTAAPESTQPPEATFTPSPSSPPPLVILLAGPEADPGLAAEAQSILGELTQEGGLRLEKRQTLGEADLGEALHLVVALPPAPALGELAAAAPQIQFVAVGIAGLQPTPNLALIGGQGDKPESLGFVAGVMAAVATDDYRIGIISPTDTSEGQAARQGFVNGVRYYCGLCRQAYPPFYDYPLFAGAPAGAGAGEWQAAADLLLGQAVETVYVAPGAGDEALLEYLAQSGAILIGTTSPPESLRPNWMATIRPDLAEALRQHLPRAISGELNGSISVPIAIDAVNADLLSPGRQAFVEAIIPDLAAGLIDPLGNE